MKKLSSSLVIITLGGLLMLWTSCSGEKTDGSEVGNRVNIAVNPGFEGSFSDTWEIAELMGAQGSGVVTSDAKRSGKTSLNLSKTNSFGYVQLASKKPVRVEFVKCPGNFLFNSKADS
jgi:hypothetical protein